MKRLSLILGTVILIAASLAVAPHSLAKDTSGEVTYIGGDVILNPDPDPTGGEDELALTLPSDLNFGSHAIQTHSAESLVATKDGDQASELTKGAIRIRDQRGEATPIGWSIKVNQTKQFTSVGSGAELVGAELTIFSNPTITNSFNTAGALKSEANLVFDEINEDKLIFWAPEGSGDGESILKLDKFQLDVLKNTAKVKEKYVTTLVWTVSAAP